ncbi:MAG TPA: sigma 54-interacting transcriptional regulator, partial [Gemmataceae bacterium]|nr:sigma 54-interacting transcriptional regulator [Gemmataceae bacterium]
TIEVGDGTPRTCKLEPDRPVTLGRNRSNTIVLQDEHVSRWHAEIYLEDGCWLIRDCGTVNGTKLNGQRIQQPTALADGQLICLGDTRLRIHLNGAPSGAGTAGGAAGARPASALISDSVTLLHADELTALCRFMSDCAGEGSFEELVRVALETVHRRTGATLTGFLSLDADNPVPKLVVPDLASVDVHLSRQLTQKVQSEGEPVWLDADADEALRADSLSSFRDALCLPLCSGGAPFGAVHVYKTGATFTERDFAFGRVLADYLASRLQVHRTQRRLEAENLRLRGHAPAGEKIIGDSPALRQLRKQIARLAPQPCSVLITGESGAGKELVALALHRQSARADGPLVVVNCAAISATLPEAELFGHCKGAFTDAHSDRPGLFQQAHEGTLFLDEIGDLSLDCQAKLLRAIETKRVRPVGGRDEIQADVRIVAATNQDLGQMVRVGTFRSDLYYRLSVPVAVPALRDHAEDIPALVEHFLAHLAREYRRSARLTDAGLALARAYPWPGNVRQLRSVLEIAIATCDGDFIDVRDLRLEAATDGPAQAGGPPSLDLEELETWAIRKAMRQTKHNVTQAASILGIHRETLATKLRKYGIDKEA